MKKDCLTILYVILFPLIGGILFWFLMIAEGKMSYEAVSGETIQVAYVGLNIAIYHFLSTIYRTGFKELGLHDPMKNSSSADVIKVVNGILMFVVFIGSTVMIRQNIEKRINETVSEVNLVMKTSMFGVELYQLSDTSSKKIELLGKINCESSYQDCADMMLYKKDRIIEELKQVKK